MSKLEAKVSEILVYNPNSSEGFADTFVFEPAEKNEMPLGKLLILVNFSEKTKKTAEISEAIASLMQNKYYSATEREPEEQFEWAVKQVNDILGDLASAGEVSWIGKIHCIIAALNGEDVYLTSTGQAQAYLVRKGQLSQLNRETSSVPHKPNPLKTFENIISGQCSTDDKLVLLSPAILDYVAKSKIKEIAHRFTPDIAARHLNSRLISFKEKVAMAALIASISEVSYQPKNRSKTPQSKQYPEKPKPELPKTPTKPHQMPKPERKDENSLQKTSGLIRSIAQKTAKQTRQIFGKSPKNRPTSVIKGNENITSRKSFTYTDTRPKPWWKKLGIMLANIGKELWRQFRKWFDKLPRMSKILFIIVILLLLAFLISLAAVRSNKDTQEQKAVFDAKTVEARQKEEEAEAAIIYGNDTKARKLLEESKALAEEVQNSKFENDEAGAILVQIEDDYLKLDKISKVNDPETVFDITQLGDSVAPSGLSLSSDYLVAYNADQPTLYTYNLESSEAKAVEVEAQGAIKSQAANADEIALLTTEPTFVRYDFTTDTAPAVSSEMPDDQQIAAIKLFGNRLYTLDPVNNRIQRHSATIGGFSKGNDWLSEGSSITDGVDLAIDGSIYVLNKNGSISKFLRGDPQAFEIKNLSEPLNDPTGIFTDDETENLYILDPKNKRLVVLDKEGNLKDQYVSDSFDDLKGMAISEAENKAYLLNGKKVLGILLNK